MMAKWVLGIEPQCSARAVSVLNEWVRPDVLLTRDNRGSWILLVIKWVIRNTSEMCGLQYGNVDFHMDAKLTCNICVLRLHSGIRSCMFVSSQPGHAVPQIHSWMSHFMLCELWLVLPTSRTHPPSSVYGPLSRCLVMNQVSILIKRLKFSCEKNGVDHSRLSWEINNRWARKSTHRCVEVKQCPHK